MKLYFLLISLCLYCNSIFAQLGDAQDVIDVAQDLISLTDQYSSPIAKATIFQSSGGWYTSVKPKDKFEVELSLQYNVLAISNAEKSFTVNEAQLKNITIQGAPTVVNIPTALGNDNVVVLEGSINGDTFEFDAPEGLNSNIVQHGQIQASIGLWKNTSFVVRYTPNISIDESDYGAVGFGVLHNLDQWVPSLKDNNFNLAFLGTYSRYYMEYEFKQVDLIVGALNTIEVTGEYFGFNLIGSKSIKNFDFSLGLGVGNSQFNYEIGGQGDFILDILNTGLKPISDSAAFKTDVAINYNLKNFSVNTMLTIGEYYNLIFGVNYNFNLSKSI